MIESQSSIYSWADATFGVPVSDASIAARALVEMAELVTACVNGEPAERIGEEIADVVIVLARLGRGAGVDVIEEVLRPGRLDTNSTTMYLAASVVANLAEMLSCASRSRMLGLKEHLREGSWYLGDLAARVGVYLPAVIDAKMAVNRARKWVPDGHGHGSHVREA